MSAMAAAPKDTVSQVEVYSDTTSLDSAMTADMGDWDDADDGFYDDDDWESSDSRTLVGRMGLDGMFGSMVFVIVICFIFFVLAPVAVLCASQTQVERPVTPLPSRDNVQLRSYDD